MGYSLITKSAYELIEAIGYDAAMKLFGIYGGESLYIPMFRDEKLTERNRLIKEDRSKGVSAQNLALKYRISLRVVYLICAEPLCS